MNELLKQILDSNFLHEYENWLDENYPNETHAEATRRIINFCESNIN